MISVGTIVNVMDNSGVKEVRVIRIGSKLRYANIGDIVRCSVRKCKGKGSIRKGKLFFGLVIQTRYGVRCNNGMFIKFNNNGVVLLDNRREMIGTKVLGIVVRKLIGKECELGQINYQYWV